ncbi:MAG: [Muribaculaceae bacterium]|nr:[FeFe] hydrogenase H-cluster maturation GTPase HydF [Muribaculaceae bacterium]
MAERENIFNRTPQSERLHIALFGRRNVGKSSLINALTGQQIALVSDVPGTTTDPVIKSMEILPLGPCVLIDTAGFDDSGKVGDLRTERTREVIKQTDIAILVTDGTSLDDEAAWAGLLKQADVPYVTVLNKTDLFEDKPSTLLNDIAKRLGCEVIAVSALQGTGLDSLRQTLAKLMPDHEKQSLTGNLANAGDTVLLVMPQDPQAPKGRLILPQVQTLRDLMDKGCIAVCCTTQDIDRALASLHEPPQLIITDSQVFDIVEQKKPAESRLTSFSVLMAAHKGDINYFVESAKAINTLTEQSRVLIAEACTHAPLAEDIGRVKIPRLLRQRMGEGLQIDIVAGKDFPEDLKGYDLVIHCGGCMFNRRFMLSRLEQCRAHGVPMTNYGITIAHIKGILDKVSLPF